MIIKKLILILIIITYNIIIQKLLTVHTNSINKLWSVVTGICDITLAGAVSYGSSTYSHKFFKCFPKFWVKYSVDHRIDKAVHITQPCG